MIPHLRAGACVARWIPLRGTVQDERGQIHPRRDADVRVVGHLRECFVGRAALEPARDPRCYGCASRAMHHLLGVIAAAIAIEIVACKPHGDGTTVAPSGIDLPPTSAPATLPGASGSASTLVPPTSPQNTECQRADDCSFCPFSQPFRTSADCKCVVCESAPMSVARCEVIMASYRAACSSWAGQRDCPSPERLRATQTCATNRVPACVRGSCEETLIELAPKP
jgi:hypothetical protein